jgi:sucrose-6-phosphate hydrolase SacC (GH32 family)
MNDPNGLFYDDKRGVYHLYYQCMSAFLFPQRAPSNK